MRLTILYHSMISPSIHLIPPSLLLHIFLHIALVHAESQPFIQWFQHDTPRRQNVSLIWPAQTHARTHMRSTKTRAGAIECLCIRPWLCSRDGEAECYHKQKSPCFYIKHKKGRKKYYFHLFSAQICTHNSESFPAHRDKRREREEGFVDGIPHTSKREREKERDGEVQLLLAEHAAEEKRKAIALERCTFVSSKAGE